MIEQRSALLHLLSDDDPATLELVKAQLSAAGAARLPDLEGLLVEAPPVAARHLREVIGDIERRDADAVFAAYCKGFGEDGDLEEAAWRLAGTFLPGEDFSRQRAQLESWAAEVEKRFKKAGTELDRIETLVEFLGDEVGLHGNDDDYYNINNSLLPEVIDTRLGIPISLSLVYLFVARRARLPFTGVGLPGHFLVRCGPHFFDPYHRGHRVGMDECRALVEQSSAKLSPQHLRPVSSRQMLTRVLANLSAIAREADPPLEAKINGWIADLNGRSDPSD